MAERIQRLTDALARFRDQPGALAECFAGALCVQALLIAYHLAVVRALDIPISAWDLAVIVPLSFIVQMVPVSVNGFGVREATFSLYFARVGLPIQSGVLVSLGATVLMMVFSLSGAALYMSQTRESTVVSAFRRTSRRPRAYVVSASRLAYVVSALGGLTVSPSPPAA